MYYGCYYSLEIMLKISLLLIDVVYRIIGILLPSNMLLWSELSWLIPLNAGELFYKFFPSDQSSITQINDQYG